MKPFNHLKYLKNFARHPLISGSAILFIGSTTGNVFHFLFNLYMSRYLSVVEYGILVSLTTLVFLPGIFAQSIIPTTISFATTFITQKDEGSLKGLFIKINKLMIFFGILLALIFTILNTQIATFLNITGIERFVSFLGLIIFFGLMSNVNMAFLQAKLSFKYASFVTFLGGFLKFIFGISFIYLGFRIGGVLFGLIASNIVVYFIGVMPLIRILRTKAKTIKIKSKSLFTFGAPTTIAFLALASFINMDIILVKHLLPAHDAGLYAGLSLIGKVVIYFSAPIGSVMFPLIVKKHTLGLAKEKTLIASLGMVIIPSALITTFYYLAPEFSINFFLKRDEYQALSDVLGFFAVSMSLNAILHILTTFYLSIKKTKIYIPILIGALAQITLIYFYHESFQQIISITAIITFLLIISLLLYYPHAEKKEV